MVFKFKDFPITTNKNYNEYYFHFSSLFKASQSVNYN